MRMALQHSNTHPTNGSTALKIQKNHLRREKRDVSMDRLNRWMRVTAAATTLPGAEQLQYTALDGSEEYDVVEPTWSLHTRIRVRSCVVRHVAPATESQSNTVDEWIGICHCIGMQCAYAERRGCRVKNIVVFCVAVMWFSAQQISGPSRAETFSMMQVCVVSPAKVDFANRFV